ncbi:MAG TPA: GNAT family N-acetyltransferase [Gemmatimonadaceae bacterium]|nr:GNAT family N-acetyltransferase [Gemmatimonadaceae bacterium]
MPQTASAFVVRAAQSTDSVRMLDIWERSVRATHHFLTENDVRALAPLVAAELESDAFGWWVLEAADTVVGFLGVAGNAVEALFLDPAHLRHGGGRVLVEHAQRLAHVPLRVDVNEQNAAARRFYEALGFVVVARSPTDSAGRAFPILHMNRTR